MLSEKLGLASSSPLHPEEHQNPPDPREKGNRQDRDLVKVQHSLGTERRARRSVFPIEIYSICVALNMYDYNM